VWKWRPLVVSFCYALHEQYLTSNKGVKWLYLSGNSQPKVTRFRGRESAWTCVKSCNRRSRRIDSSSSHYSERGILWIYDSWHWPKSTAFTLGTQHLVSLLSGFFNPPPLLKKCRRLCSSFGKGSRDGFDATDFHRHCDKVGPTICVARTSTK